MMLDSKKWITMSVEEIADDSDGRMESAIDDGKFIMITNENKQVGVLLPIDEYMRIISEIDTLSKRIQ